MIRLLARIFRRRKRERLPHAWLVQAAGTTAEARRQAKPRPAAYRKGWSA